MAVRWSRVQLYLSVLTCQGLFATLRERIQFAPAPTGAAGAILPGSENSIQLPRYYDYAGAVHVHSTYSDGIGSVRDIADAANHAGLDFVVLCDHASLEARTNGEDGWHGRTLVVVGTEVTTDAGHLLALNVPAEYLPVTHEPREAQSRIVDLGGIGFVALPCDLKDHWRDFAVRDSRMGLEVFNLSAIARTKINLPAMALVWSRYRGSKPQKAFHWVAARPDREIKLWDSLICERRRLHGESAPYNVVVSIGSIDAHGVMKFGGKAYELPTYAEVFRTLRTHVLLMEPLTCGDSAATDAKPDLDAVHGAIGSGHSYAAYDNYGDSTGFVFECETASGRALMGDTVTAPAEGGLACRLVARVPKTRSFIRLYRDGRLVAAARGGCLEYITHSPGAYRVEVYLFKSRVGNLCLGAKPWIFSNPIYVQPAPVPTSRPPAGAKSRTDRA